MSDFILSERTVETLKTLKELKLKRRIDSKDAKTGKVSSREVRIDAPPPKNPGPHFEISDWIFIVGRTESGFEREFRCLLFSNENLGKVEDFLTSVIPGWNEPPEPPSE